MSALPQIDLKTNDSNRSQIVSAARSLLRRVLPADERDDRFDLAWELDMLAPSTPVWSSVGFDGATPVALLVGVINDDGVLRLEALHDPNLADPVGVLWAQLAALDSSVRHGQLGQTTTIEIWARPSPPWFAAAIERAGYEPFRGVHQMTAPLPLPDAPAPVATRSYTNADAEALRLVNNRSFANHPSQGDQSAERWLETIDAPWFLPDGVRLYEDPPGTIAGFCITKIHQTPQLGEIYVIGLDPSVHGRRLGGPMTAAGLDWLAAQGQTTAMLYVEADNEPALRTYERLGFSIVRTDAAWQRSLIE